MFTKGIFKGFVEFCFKSTKSQENVYRATNNVRRAFLWVDLPIIVQLAILEKKCWEKKKEFIDTFKKTDKYILFGDEQTLNTVERILKSAWFTSHLEIVKVHSDAELVDNLLTAESGTNIRVMLCTSVEGKMDEKKFPLPTSIPPSIKDKHIVLVRNDGITDNQCLDGADSLTANVQVKEHFPNAPRRIIPKSLAESNIIPLALYIFAGFTSRFAFKLPWKGQLQKVQAQLP